MNCQNKFEIKRAYCNCRICTGTVGVDVHESTMGVVPGAVIVLALDGRVSDLWQTDWPGGVLMGASLGSTSVVRSYVDSGIVD